VDWKGTADWDGHEYGWEGNEAWRTRSDWSRQRFVWDQTCQMLAGIAGGVEVIRHTLHTDGR
jgi:hypothetical protein